MAQRATPRVGFVLLLAILCSSMSYAAVFNVNTAAGFQTALDTAETNGEPDTINLAAGSYLTSANGNDTFAAILTDGFSLEVAGAGTGATFLDGNGAHQALRLDSSAGAPAITVRDLTMRGCGASGVSAVFGGCAAVSSGGGAAAGALLIERVVITASTLTAGAFSVFGGGLDALTEGDLTLRDVTVSSLTVTTSGGGSIFGGALDLQGQNVTLTDVALDTVSATAGGSVFGGAVDILTADDGATVTIDRLRIVDSSATAGLPSGSLFSLFETLANNDNVTTIVRDLTMTRNTASDGGSTGSLFGAIFAYVGGNDGGQFTLERGYLVDNEISESGDGSIFGGVADVLDSGSGGTVAIINSAIGNNRVTEADAGSIFGSGLEVGADLTRILHNTIWDTIATEGGDGTTFGGGLAIASSNITADIFNNVVWGNFTSGAADDVFLSGSNSTFNYFNNDVGGFFHGGGTLNQGGNINVDPQLVGFATGNFHLTASSPVIDLGSLVLPLAVTNDFDLDPRPIGFGPDMGADERLALISVADIPTLGIGGFAALAAALGALALARLRRA